MCHLFDGFFLTNIFFNICCDEIGWEFDIWASIQYNGMEEGETRERRGGREKYKEEYTNQPSMLYLIMFFFENNQKIIFTTNYYNCL